MEGTTTHLWWFGSEISEEARFGTRFAVEARPGQTVTAIAGHLPFCNGCSMDYLYKRCGYWVRGWDPWHFPRSPILPCQRRVFSRVSKFSEPGNAYSCFDPETTRQRVDIKKDEEHSPVEITETRSTASWSWEKRLCQVIDAKFSCQDVAFVVLCFCLHISSFILLKPLGWIGRNHWERHVFSSAEGLRQGHGPKMLFCSCWLGHDWLQTLVLSTKHVFFDRWLGWGEGVCTEKQWLLGVHSLNWSIVNENFGVISNYKYIDHT